MNGANNSLVSYNRVALTSATQGIGITVSVYMNSSLLWNKITGPGSASGNGLILFDMQNGSASNNTLSGFNTTLLSEESGNVTFNGNVLSCSYVALNLTATNDSLFFHNDFVNYTGAPIVMSGSSGEVFNSSLPLGGNYWQAYNGSNSNNDGIGDSSYYVAGTYYDYLPLMKPWVRPQVIFHENGLSTNTSWTVTFNGKTGVSTSDSIAFYIINGTYQDYSYVLQNTTMYYETQYNGSLSYTGSSLNLGISYLHYSYITGKVNPANFPVYLNGKKMSTVNGTFIFTVTAGNYSVEIVENGYNTFNRTYNISAGQTLFRNLTLNKTSTGSSPLIYYAAAAVALVVAQ